MSWGAPLDDNFFEAAMAFRVAEEQAFIGGDGASEPMGIMEYNQNTLKMDKILR